MTAIATGIRIGWIKLTTFATIQMTEHAIVISTTMKTAVSVAHIVLRCQGVGYFVIRGRSGARVSRSD